jgi:hypothetical protein
MMRELKWCCKNQDCKRMNFVDSSHVEEAMKKNLKVLLICGTCGFVHNQSKMNGPEEKSWLACIPYTSTESRLPMGKLTDDNYLDYAGRPCNRNDFILKYGIDPKRYLNWRDAGKPKSKVVCE